jgi:hypothetical protein
MAQSKIAKREKERAEAEWRANEERVNGYSALFNALPDGFAKVALLDAMTDRVIDLFNNVRMEEGDSILEFMPNEHARSLLDWYFHDEDPNSVFTPKAPDCSHEGVEQGQVQGGAQDEVRPNGLGVVEADAEREAAHIPVAPSEPARAHRDRSRVDDIVAAAEDLVALWQSPKIQGLPRADRNAAIEETRRRLIEAVRADR